MKEIESKSRFISASMSAWSIQHVPGQPGLYSVSKPKYEKVKERTRKKCVATQQKQHLSITFYVVPNPSDTSLFPFILTYFHLDCNFLWYLQKYIQYYIMSHHNICKIKYPHQKMFFVIKTDNGDMR